MRKRRIPTLIIAVGALLGYLAATGQLSLGQKPDDAKAKVSEPGSPSGTTTVDGKYLPNPPAAFGGVVNLEAKNSKPYWPARVVPPKGAPNVLLIMTDDQGYGVSGTFGGVVPTPNMDRIAKMGLRYTCFNSTALCSPTRAPGRRAFDSVLSISTTKPSREASSTVGPSASTGISIPT